MTGYRLSFGVQHLRANDLSDSVMAVDDTVGQIVSSLGDDVEVIGHDYLIALMSSQIIVRFTAPTDETAYAAANAALRAVSLPIDGERIERRSRRYVPIGA